MARQLALDLDPGKPKRRRSRKVAVDATYGKPRADFQCGKCEELYVLPVAAKACPDPECGGELSRVWAGTPPGTKSARTKLVDKVVGDEFQRAKDRAARPQFKKEFATRVLPPAAAAGQIGADGKMVSRGYNVPIILGLPGGPTPNWYRG